MSTGKVSWRLVFEADGGYRLEGPEGERVEVRRAGADQWEVLLPGGTRARLRRAEGWAGFVLESEEREKSEGAKRIAPGEAAGFEDEPHPPLTTRAPAPPGAWAGATLLLEDGRLFWIVPGEGRRFELRDWEVPGTYWVAAPEGEGWRLEPTVAGRALEAPPALFVLFGAEVLEAAAGAE